MDLSAKQGAADTILTEFSLLTLGFKLQPNAPKVDTQPTALPGQVKIKLQKAGDGLFNSLANLLSKAGCTACTKKLNSSYLTDIDTV